MNILITTFSIPSFKDNIFDGKFVLGEAIAYSENGATVKIIAPYYLGAEKTEIIQDRITIIRFQYFFPKSLQVLKQPGRPIYGQKTLLAMLQIPFLAFFFIINILKHARWADIIHAQWTVSALFALPAKWLFGTSIVLTARGSDLTLLPKWLNRLIHSKVDAAIDCFGPQKWNNQYKQNFPAKFVTLPLLVHSDPSEILPEDMNKIVKRKQNPFIILYVGRFDYIKLNNNKLPLMNLIYAGNVLRENNENFHVFYVGSGDEAIRNEMLRLIKEHKLDNYISLLGPKNNVLDYVQFCHLGVGGIAFNAVSEEFTMSGKAQILVEGEDNLDTPWRHGINVIFIKPDDYMDLAAKLTWSIEHRSELKQIGKNAQMEMKEYITDSKTGGILYLREFNKLIKQS